MFALRDGIPIIVTIFMKNYTYITNHVQYLKFNVRLKFDRYKWWKNHYILIQSLIEAADKNVIICCTIKFYSMLLKKVFWKMFVPKFLRLNYLSVLRSKHGILTKNTLFNVLLCNFLQHCYAIIALLEPIWKKWTFRENE